LHYYIVSILYIESEVFSHLLWLKIPPPWAIQSNFRKLSVPNRSFYINLPAALADAVQLVKGEDLEWFIEDKNTSSSVRKNPVKALKLKH
jgi:hypothetical protein